LAGWVKFLFGTPKSTATSKTTQSDPIEASRVSQCYVASMLHKQHIVFAAPPVKEEGMSGPQPPKKLPGAPSPTPPAGITRRGFLKGAGITAAGTALIEGVQGFSREAAAETPAGIKEYGSEPFHVSLHVNGKERALEIEPRTTLADALRIQLNMTGTKISCDRGVCSSCTVWLDKIPVNSCMTLAIDAVGHQITTIEGVSADEQLHPIQTAFLRHDAMQCGFCTPGMVMSCAALLEKNPHPTATDVRHAVSGNLCRCGTYPRIVAAALEAAGQKA
jgi:xanthine dehydrogenase YagT iron-sulfur-binding subunit